MEKITYPLLCFKIKKDAYLGLLVGTEIQVVDKDIRNIKAILSDYLNKKYRKYNDYIDLNIESPKLKIIDVRIRPTYTEEDGSYPQHKTIKVPIVTVYGENNSGYYECYLPLFDASFYYYDNRQFTSLVTHFATNLLNNKTPEEVNTFLLHKKPTLDSISIKINRLRDYDWGDWAYDKSYETLSRLTERYPYSKAVQRNIRTFPDAAWELEDKVLDVIEKLINVRSNLLLVGNHGVGKSAVLKQAIKKLTQRGKKQKLDFTFWQLMPQRITASSKYLGQWQETCESLIEDLGVANGILWVINFIQLLQTGGEGPEDSVAAFLISFLQRGQLQIVGEVTPQELESMRRLLPNFAQNFQTLNIDELNESKIFGILDKFSNYSTRHYQIDIVQESRELTYRLLRRYYPYESFPGKAVKFLSQCVDAAKLAKHTNISRVDVIDNFVKQTGMPELFLRDDILLDEAELQKHFNSKIIGQEKAVKNLCNIVKIFKAGLNNPYKPIATLVFAGPTGVGKTASAKALAAYFFGKGQQRSPLIRIDMSEFQHPEQISRFIGTGEEVGKLVKEIRERPFSVLLLDEIEKADASIFDALLTILDEGLLVDAYGRVTNFRNTIVIMTTNLGAAKRKSIGFVQEDDKIYEAAIARHFRPEFVNRIDSIILFNALTKEDVIKITFKELSELKKREGFIKRSLDIRFSQRLIGTLAMVGFDPRYGARPLQRAIEEVVVAPLAKWLLNHPNLKEKVIGIDFNGELVIMELKLEDEKTDNSDEALA